MRFHDPDLATFLRDYWQRRPLLLRQGIADFRDPLSPEELAGIACEDSAEARLVFQREDGWELRSGPFSESDFTALPEAGWTLLVQGVDQWLAEVKALLRHADFIPRWRLDDVMISYATAGAGVGPHFDYYDVFIIQGKGSRRWRIGQRCDSGSALDTRSGLKILENFETREEWLLEPGDVLYIPPGVAHYGIAEEAGLSYSIGFRAPSLEEVLGGFIDEVCQGLTEDRRYKDPLPIPHARPGEIAPQVLGELECLIKEASSDRRALSLWFGRHVSEQKQHNILALPEQPVDDAELAGLLRDGLELERNPLSRFAWIDGGAELLLFADGESFALPVDGASMPALVRLLCEAEDDEALDLLPFLDHAPSVSMLSALYNQGSLIVHGAGD